MRKDLIESVSHGVATLTMSRPDSLNALSDDMMDGLLESFDRLSSDSSVGAIVLTGGGRAFCAGGDLKNTNGSYQQRASIVSRAHRIALAITQCPKVTIASINGDAMGAGLSLALCCDFRLVAHSARLGLPFVKVGLASDTGATWHLPRLIGIDRARELLLTGDLVDAEKAAEMGMVTRVVADVILAEFTLGWARRFAKGPVLAQAGIKHCLLAAESHTSFAEHLSLEESQQLAITDTEDHREGVRAFIERRKAVFRGQ